MKKLTIAVDFDGVIVTENYPEIGRLMNGAKETLDKWYQNHTVIINTCRSGVFLDHCRDYLYVHEIKYHYLNENSQYLINRYGTYTRKISADVYIDDKNLGGFCGWQKADDYVTWMANRKPVIICIIGESGSGKTTLADYIETTFGVSMIQSYTTRPKRTPNETGHTFVSDAMFDAFPVTNMVAYTKFGAYRYCCLHSDIRSENTYVIDEVGLKYLKENFSDRYDIKTIRVTCGEAERIERAGGERVARDRGKFTMPAVLFDFMWRTDSWRDGSYNRKRDYDDLHNFVNKTLNRGWN